MFSGFCFPLSHFPYSFASRAASTWSEMKSWWNTYSSFYSRLIHTTWNGMLIQKCIAFSETNTLSERITHLHRRREQKGSSSIQIHISNSSWWERGLMNLCTWMCLCRLMCMIFGFCFWKTILKNYFVAFFHFLSRFSLLTYVSCITFCLIIFNTFIF